MADRPIGDDDYVADAEHHNQWWSSPGTPPSDLTEITDLPTRSDLHRLLERTNRLAENEVGSATYAIYGQTGIGKTTLLKQFIAALLPDGVIDYSPSHRTIPITGALDPRQILYVPLEESLYHTIPPDRALDALLNVIEYHQSRIAPRNETRYVILDDIGAIELSHDDKARLIDALEMPTYLVLTGIVRSQTKLPVSQVNESIGPVPMLPMKFIDALKQSGFSGDGPGDITVEFAELLEYHQSNEANGLLHKIKKQALANRDVKAAVSALIEFYTEVLTPEQHAILADAAREYLRTGGLLFRARPDDVRNDLVRSHFLLYLYKELARYESIKQPENLHRLCAIAANSSDKELNYNNLSDALGVDRRTVDTYFDALDDGLALTESHEYALQRHRRTRAYLRNPRHVVTLSQRHTHYGYESYDPESTPNAAFERKLAHTVGFDHAMRLAYGVNATQHVEYTEIDAGTIDYLLRLPHGDTELVLPFVLDYAPDRRDSTTILSEFDPSSGTHLNQDGSPRTVEYEAPVRFIVTDREPSLPFTTTRSGYEECTIPYWLFLLLA